MTRLELGDVRSVQAAVRSLQRVVDRLSELVGAPALTAFDERLLEALDREPGPSTTGGLARVLAVHPNTTYRRLARMVDLGLVVRRRVIGDRRRIAYDLTPAGVALIESRLGPPAPAPRVAPVVASARPSELRAMRPGELAVARKALELAEVRLRHARRARADDPSRITASRLGAATSAVTHARRRVALAELAQVQENR
jgi:DNA-binding MarR family transcriptional regulator